MAARSRRSSKSKGSTKRRRSTRRRSKPGFLKRTHKAVRGQLSAATDLPTFLGSAGALTLAGRRRLVDQAIVLLEGNYVHRPLKEAMHGVDPIQRLRLVQHRLQQATTATMGSEYRFHREMLDIFNSVRDLHTNYILPTPFQGTVAFLPFQIEEYFDGNENPHYIATHFVQGFTHPHFKPGVEIRAWSGVPIDRAIDVSGDRHAGSNLAARHVRGLDGLTIRPLAQSLPPDEEWVVVEYTDLNGNDRELRQDWLVTPELSLPGGVNPNSVDVHAASLGVDIGADLTRNAKMMLFAPKAISETKRRAKLSTRKAAAGAAVATTMPGVFSARSVATPSGVFGHVRIFTFSVDDPVAFVREFIRIVGLLPSDGLILDVRGNGGGHIWASEGLLQTLTPYEVSPEPVQFINTQLNLRICRQHEKNPSGIDLGPWVDSMERAVETGAVYSSAHPITPEGFANRFGQHYHGPAVLVTDARCYSATDIFAAGFQDHDIGTILGVDDNTGAGGANVWTHRLLKQLLELPAPDPSTPYEALPGQANMRVSIRRTLRVGEKAGTPVEDLGIEPDERYFLTEGDLLNSNVDLLARAGEILAASTPVRELRVTASRSGTQLSVSAVTRGLDRIDTYVDGRPLDTRGVSAGAVAYVLTAPASAGLLEIAGYHHGSYVAARKLEI